jgi:hypothetical protein
VVVVRCVVEVVKRGGEELGREDKGHVVLAG